MAATPAPELLRRHFPGLVQASWLGVAAWQWLAMLAALAGAVGIGVALSRLFHLLSRSFAPKPQSSWLVSLSRAIQTPLASLLAVGAFDWAVHYIDLVGNISVIVDTVASQLLIAGGAWLLVLAGRSLAADLERNLLGDDEFASRGARTQVRLARHVWTGLVVLLALATALSGFHAVRTIGMSLLASAGIVGIVAGIAAQKSLGGVVAGIQLSMTQQLRIGDTVVVDTEFGTVEEIHLTFVVLRLWDLRRLIVPATHFLEQSFQNWTRVRTHLVGSVELWVDYAAPLAPLREELARVCHASKLWDGQSCVLQVTDASDKALKLRMLVSAAGASGLFDLRCEVRERIAALLQSLDGGIYLPHDRSSNLPEAAPAPGTPGPPAT
jgi:small-conductance mechanosensitive channel